MSVVASRMASLRNDRRRLIGAIAAAAVCVAVVGLLAVGLVHGGVETSINTALKAGDRPAAPDISLPVLVAGDGVGPVGVTTSLQQLKGRPIVLNVWASWCVPCRDEAPMLDSIARAYRNRGALVLGLDVQDLTGKARDFVRHFHLTYPSLRDGSDGTQARLQTTGVPETFLIDRQGRIALHIVGPVSRPEQVTTALEELL